jgi:hypothetical protein
VRAHAGVPCLADASHPADDDRRTRDWLTAHRARLAPWDDRREHALVESFALGVFSRSTRDAGIQQE